MVCLSLKQCLVHRLSACCFDEVNKEMNQYREWKQELLHQCSLLHTIALQTLRLDDNLDNLREYYSRTPSDDAGTALEVMKTALGGRTVMQSQCLEEWLGTIDFFQKKAAHLAPLARELVPVFYNDGEVVFLQGDVGDALYLIVRGEVDIIAGGSNVGSMVPGQCFGDRALEARGGDEVDTRTATVVAVGDVVLARLGVDAYYDCVGKRGSSAEASAVPRSLQHSSRSVQQLDRSASYRSEGDIQHSAKEAAEHPLGVIGGLRDPERMALLNCETFNGARMLIAQTRAG